jgi:hypothetical protein
MSFLRKEKMQIGLCCLTKTPTKNPVIFCVKTKGYIYDKEAIIKHIIHEKQIIKEKNAQYIQQLEHTRDNANKRVYTKKVKEQVDFIKVSSSLTHKKQQKKTDGNALQFNYWLPSSAPAVEAIHNRTPPVGKVLCPMSRRPIAMKKLKPVNFLYNNKVLFGEPGFLLCSATSVPIINQDVVYCKKTCNLMLKSFVDAYGEGSKFKKSDLVHIVR